MAQTNFLTLKMLAQQIGAHYRGEDVPMRSVTHDTRALKPGDIYIALKGEVYDGHNFIAEAVDKGAVAIICDQSFDSNQLSVPVLQSQGIDTTEALGRIARLWRQQFTNLKVIALTGSAGKTSTRNFLVAALRQRYNTLVAVKNYNNHWGVPLTLLRLNSEHDCAVLELGANHQGEINYLTNIVCPDVALITNAGASHLEGFGGSIEKVAQAKGEIFNGLSGGTAVLNYDDLYYSYWHKRLTTELNEKVKSIITFSLKNKKACVYAGDIQAAASGNGSCFTVCTPSETKSVTIPLLGEHNVANALAAIACMHNLDVSLTQIAKGFATIEPEPGRLTKLEGIEGCQVIDDSYNASANAMLNAIKILASFSGKRFAVLGDMAELGEHSAFYHQKVGEAARDCDIDQLYLVGEKMRLAAEAYGPKAQHFSCKQTLIEALRQQLDDDVTVLVKGARSSAMEEVVAAIRATPLSKKTEDVSC